MSDLHQCNDIHVKQISELGCRLQWDSNLDLSIVVTEEMLHFILVAISIRCL